MKYFMGFVLVVGLAGFAQAEEYKVEQSTNAVVIITKTVISGDTTTIQKREVQADTELASIDKVIADLDGQIAQLESQKVKLEEKKVAISTAVSK